jgi:3-methyladenine DNA glycosylase AlkC
MTNISKEEAERLADWLSECLSHDLMPDLKSLKEASRAFSQVVRDLDAAEAEKRAAVAAAYEKAAAVVSEMDDVEVVGDEGETLWHPPHRWDVADAIRALSDTYTDALAEYAEKVRAKALEDAALECDAIAARRKGTDRGYAAEDCASNIRALKSIRSGDAISGEGE